MIRWALIIIAALGGLIAIVALVGASLPRKHTISRTLRVSTPPDALYALLVDVDRYPSWRRDLQKVERLPDRNGMPAWIEQMRSGRVPLAFERMERPSLLVARITDSSLPFGGTWTYRLQPSGRESELTITEDGEVYNPIFRFLSRFVFGHAATIDGFLKSVESTAGGPGVESRR
jgi:hypothetical protein